MIFHQLPTRCPLFSGIEQGMQLGKHRRVIERLNSC
jgi:hypothetical protein